MKTAFISVFCADSEAINLPEYFFLQISPALSKRIIELCDIVKNNNVYSISEFNGEGNWYDLDIEDDLVVDDIDAEYVVDFLQGQNTSEKRLDCKCLCVTADKFFWTAVPKHCGNDLKLSTKAIPVSLLSGEEDAYININ